MAMLSLWGPYTPNPCGSYVSKTHATLSVYALTLTFAIVFPLLPLFIMVVVTPLRTSYPCGTTTTTPFGAIVLSVSFKLVSPTTMPPPLANVPSAVGGNSLLYPKLVRSVTHVVVKRLTLKRPPMLLI